MGRIKTLTDEVMIARAKAITHVLREAGGWVSSPELSKATNLTEGQLKAAIKYERRYFLDKPEKCGNTYILSGAKGYKLPQSDEDYVSVYKSLYSWGKSVLITISPMGKYLKGKGFDVSKIREEAMEALTGNPTEHGGADSWHD